MKIRSLLLGSVAAAMKLRTDVHELKGRPQAAFPFADLPVYHMKCPWCVCALTRFSRLQIRATD